MEVQVIHNGRVVSQGKALRAGGMGEYVVNISGNDVIHLSLYQPCKAVFYIPEEDLTIRERLEEIISRYLPKDEPEDEPAIKRRFVPNPDTVELTIG